jgi:segregation and condensation protein B
MELLKQQIEALVFCSEQSISLDEISASLKLSFDWDLEDEEIIAAIEELKTKYASDEFAFELLEISEGYQFLTKKQYHSTVSALIQHKAKKKLSVSQMETLAIIAYRQPISKTDVEHIRGVSCDYAMQKLLEKELIEISGKSDGPGRPILYSTSRSFMDYFGIKSVKDLPQLKDLHMEQNEIGIPADENLLDSPSVEDFVPAESTSNVSEDFSDDLTIETDEIIAREINELPEIEIENEEKVTADLLDRKSIYLENELKNHPEEEISNPEDLENNS